MAGRNGLRTGYTTGTCAAAAAKAGALALVQQQLVEEAEVSLPIGQRAAFRVHRCQFNVSAAECWVIKDAGDDPDITHGAKIGARVEWSQEPGIVLERGDGVGVVTKPGLGLALGAPAITPVPREMILNSVGEAVNGKSRPLHISISVADGERLARKTLNPRLGIVGGLSILGTTGLVVPYSTSAYKVCISRALDVAVACGCRQVVLTTGARSEGFARRLFALPEEAFIQMGDFVGHALRACAKRPLDRIVVVGFVGKLSKVAAGHFHTHVSRSGVEPAFFAGLAAESGASPEALAQATTANTARHFLEIMDMNGVKGLPDHICAMACQRMSEVAGTRRIVECIMTDFEGQVLGRAVLG